MTLRLSNGDRTAIFLWQTLIQLPLKNKMNRADTFDKLFQQAVSAIDAGDEEGLKQSLDTHPELVTERLYSPGEWLTNVIGDALKGFFKDPYLLWFVSEDPVRN